MIINIYYVFIIIMSILFRIIFIWYYYYFTLLLLIVLLLFLYYHYMYNIWCHYQFYLIMYFQIFSKFNSIVMLKAFLVASKLNLLLLNSIRLRRREVEFGLISILKKKKKEKRKKEKAVDSNLQRILRNFVLRTEWQSISIVESFRRCITGGE